MQTVSCDWCEAVVPNTPDDLLWWARVGWEGNAFDHACSLTCAQNLVVRLWEQRAIIEAEVGES